MRKYRGHRHLKITTGGWWYIAFTILLGVVAMTSGNNVLYLIESLLLGGLIMSGVLSEKIVSSAEIKIKRKPTIVDQEAKDLLFIKNKSILPLFCIEVGEWSEGNFKVLAFIPFLSGRSNCTLESQQKYTRRGYHDWDGLYCGTRYPFGFAKKIRKWKLSGQRIVWPKGIQVSKKNSHRFDKSKKIYGLSEYVEGEVRAYQDGDDFREVVWTLTLTKGEPIVRVRNNQSESKQVILDLRKKANPDFEKEISSIAECFYTDQAHSLVVTDGKIRKNFQGKRMALNQLAIVGVKDRV